MKGYIDGKSGNCYKLQLVASLLDLSIEWHDVDILSGETRSDHFLSLNPNAKIPLLQLSDGRCLAESNAIINYLASGSSLLPQDPFLLAKVQQWQFFEQYSHEPYIAVARYINVYLGLPPDRLDEYESKRQGGHKALAVIEQALKHSNFLVGDSLTTADISLYAYTHVAHEGGFDLSQYDSIQRWLSQMESQPKFRPMDT